MISKTEIEKISFLSKIYYTNKEIESFAGDIENLEKYCSDLSSVDEKISFEKSSHNADLSENGNSHQMLSQEEALSMTAESENGFFCFLSEEEK